MNSPNWFVDASFGLHYDLHARRDHRDLWRDMTVQALVDELEKIRPDFLQCDCKGHPGYASYPTRVGTGAHLARDTLRMHREATTSAGIPLSVHYSGIWDEAAMEAHPEWARVAPDGQLTGRSCLSGGYTTELMVPQMIEIIDDYDVDGFWVDGENWAAAACYCDRCRALFRERCGLDVPEPAGAAWGTWLAFHRELFEEHVRTFTEAVHARKPECLVCSNWMYSARHPGRVSVPVDYLSGDVEPSWGIDRSILECRFFDGRNISWGLMVWSFLTGEDEWGGWHIKNRDHLLQEVAEVLACGGKVMVYAQMRESGSRVGWLQGLLADAAGFCRARRDACLGTTSIPEAAILHSATSHYSGNEPLYGYGGSLKAVEGALHAVLDAGYHADVIDESVLDQGLSRWSLIVVPEQHPMDERVLTSLADYARTGGHLVMSGTHIAVDPILASLADVADVGLLDNAFYALPFGGETVTVAGPWRSVVSSASDTSEIPLLTGDDPAADLAGTAAITLRGIEEGRVLAAHGPLFAAYRQTRYPRLGRLLATLFREVASEPKVTVEVPEGRSSRVIGSSLRRRQTGSGEQVIIHLVNRGAEPRFSSQQVMVESVPPMGPVRVRLALSGVPTAVRALPSDVEVDWEWTAGMLEARVAEVGIHAALVVSLPPVDTLDP